MKRVLVTNAGRGTAINFCRSLRLADEKIEIIGIENNPYSIFNAEVDQKFLCPDVESEDYLPFLKDVIRKTKANFIYPSKTNEELWLISRHRDEFEKMGVKTFLPEDSMVQIYEDKYQTYKILRENGVPVAETTLLHNEDDLKRELQNRPEGVWIRAIKGCGGKGSTPATDFDFAKAWIDKFDGWGNFTASEILGKKTATWSGLWKDGELIISQVRKRLYWEFSYLSPSGVTGITGAQMTAKDKGLDEIAMKAILSVCEKPHGIVAVDFTYDKDDIKPYVTEIQASRFYTSSYFMAKAGLNLPYIMLKMAFDEELPVFEDKFSPLEEGLVWIKYVDCLPVLTNLKEIEKNNEALNRWRNK